MIGADERVTVALNRADFEAPAVNLAAGTYTDLITDETVTAPLSIPARSAMVLIEQ